LAPELDKALVAMKGMGLAGPIHVAGGYYILQVRDRREPAGTVVPKSEQPRTGLPDGPLPLARVLLALPAKPSAALKETALHFGEELSSHINGCGNLGAVAKQIQGAVYMNLGSLRAGQMSQELRNALATTQPGDVAKPFISSAGVEIIVRCDPKVQKVVAFQMPTRQDIQNRLYQEQMSMMSRRYLRDLRRDSVVEYR
jgi:peptidyl-prolyl cis-trans isomerase SurA